MRYFKHSELADTYHVSLKTVHNWIDAAKKGKVALQLYQNGSRTYISDTPMNVMSLSQLAQKGKKYRSSKHHKVIHPSPEFFEIYSRRQILDIINNLNVHGEIPRQYNYLEDGAKNWDDWLIRLAKEETSNLLKGSIELLRANMGAIDRLIGHSKKVNIVDLGVGNAYPVKELLGHLINKGCLHRYIAVDISPTMLEIAKNNVWKWYGDKVPFESHVRDISYEHFDDLLVDDMLKKEADETLNLVLLLGATPINFRSFNDVFHAVHGSMGGRDFLVYTDKPDTEASRGYFSFSSHPRGSKLSSSHQYILNLLNIDESLYEAEVGFDAENRMRYVRARLNVAITIKFEFEGIERVVSLEKGDTILLLRAWHLTASETISVLEDTGFTLVQSSLTEDREYFLSISAVEVKQS